MAYVKKWNHQTFIRAVTEYKYYFACTPAEFVQKFGHLSNASKEQQEDVSRLACLCKDGIIRPRDLNERRDSQLID